MLYVEHLTRKKVTIGRGRTPGKLSLLRQITGHREIEDCLCIFRVCWPHVCPLGGGVFDNEAGGWKSKEEERGSILLQSNPT